MRSFRYSIVAGVIAFLVATGGHNGVEFTFHQTVAASGKLAENAKAEIGKDEEKTVTDTGTGGLSEKNNHIDYVELAAEDLPGVKKFYGAAFGWTFEDWGPDYIAFSGAGIEGGFRGGEKPVAGSTLVILYADDLEKTEANVTAAGGKITERHEFPGGRRFHFEDPAGNILGVWVKVQDAGE